MQSLILATTKNQQNSSQENVHLGIVTPLNFPYNLFLNLAQIVDPDMSIVYFFIYSLGEKRIALWGTYNKNTQQFSIEGACKYLTRQLINIVNSWKSQNFTYVANSVKNRITETIGRYLPLKKLTYAQYLRYKFLIGYFRDLIPEDELEDKYPDEPGQFYDEVSMATKVSKASDNFELALFDYLETIEAQIKDYEKNINLVSADFDLLRSLNSNIADAVLKITQRFYDAIKNGQLNGDDFYQRLETCPDINQCVNGSSGHCEVYYYGNIDLGYLSPRDRRLLL